MKLIAALILMSVLAACGADGDPFPVGEVTEPQVPTIGLSGEVE